MVHALTRLKVENELMYLTEDNFKRKNDKLFLQIKIRNETGYYIDSVKIKLIEKFSTNTVDESKVEIESWSDEDSKQVSFDITDYALLFADEKDLSFKFQVKLMSLDISELDNDIYGEDDY